MTDRFPVEMNARLLGTASGWDGEPFNSIWFYDFQPADGVPLPSCSAIMFDVDAGQLYVQDDQGEHIGPAYDIPTFLVALPRIVKAT